MSNKKFPISYCFAAYNEEEIIENTVIKLKKELTRKFGTKGYEILIVENGSTDSTIKILNKIKFSNLHIIQAPRKSHGLALRMAVENAKFEHIIITGADLPFGFSDLNLALKQWDKYDIIFGSKLHPQSDYPTNPNRKSSSKIYSFLLNTFFNIGIKDVQGSLFLKKKFVIPLLKYCTADTAFFTTQIAIYSKLFNHRMCEIPVRRSVLLSDERKSKYNVVRDGSKMFFAILREYVKYTVLSQKAKNGVL